jgi:hypothetical protein
MGRAYLTRGLLEEGIHVELQLEFGHVEVLNVLLHGGAAFDPLPGLLIRVVRVTILGDGKYSENIQKFKYLRYHT